MAGLESVRGVIGFVRTVNAGSFASAAKELGVSPVAVSKNVQRLERRLGVRLLQRSTRKLSLTEEVACSTSVARARSESSRAPSPPSRTRGGRRPEGCA